METIINNQQQSLCNSAKKTLLCEIEALKKISTQAIGKAFCTACELILNSNGRLIVLGMGKSGHIGRKIAATLASTGTPSFFVHPAEANHGDIGMMVAQDIVIMISYSGETQEILSLLPNLKRLKIAIISITGNPDSTLAALADINLNVKIDKEACPMGLAPTSSTTATLALGDALAISLLEARDFTAEDFAAFHPGGSLGKKLLLQVDDVMYKGNQLPLAYAHDTVDKVLVEITQKNLGIAIIIDASGTAIGLFTDGDLRRTLDTNNDIKLTLISDVMTTSYHKVAAQTRASDALQIMKQNKITALMVIDIQQKPIGLLHMHALLRSGVV